MKYYRRFLKQKDRGKFSRRMKKVLTSIRTRDRLFEVYKGHPLIIEFLDDIEDFLLVEASCIGLDLDSFDYMELKKNSSEIGEDFLDRIEKALDFGVKE